MPDGPPRTMSSGRGTGAPSLRRMSLICRQLQPRCAGASGRATGRQPDEGSRGDKGLGGIMIDPRKHRQLFLDDYVIDASDGITKTLQQPTLCGACIAPFEGHDTPQSRNAPCYNGDSNRCRE